MMADRACHHQGIVPVVHSTSRFTMRIVVTFALLTASLQEVLGATARVYDIGNKRPESLYVLPDDAAAIMGLAAGDYAIASEFYYGGIQAVNLNTGEVTQVVESVGFAERTTIGVWYADGLIFAGSGGPFIGEGIEAAIHVFDASSGELLVSCIPEGGGTFINDVTTIGGTAYATDSFENRIMTLDIESAKNRDCVVSSVETPAEIFLREEEWAANGILPYADGLLIVQQTDGGVYYLDLTDNTTSEVIPAGTVVNADGLCMGSDAVLYVAQNPTAGPVTAWEMSIDNGMVSASFLGTIESVEFDSPAACGVLGDTLVVPNARFGSLGPPADGEDDLATFTETFQVVGVNRLDYSLSPLPTNAPTPTVSPTSCQTVTTQEGFDLDSYISARWYSQQQRPTPFQPAILNYCTTADYTKIEASELGFMDVYTIKVFNTAQDVNGNVFTSDDEAQVGPDPGPLCGLQEFPIVDPAMLLVGNCFDDPSQPSASGPYWVLEYDEAAGYALISGGQPDVPTQDGLCSYSSPFSGLWIFTRDSERNDTLIEEVRAMAIAQGIDPSIMFNVDQENCEYPEVPTPVPPTPTAVPPSPNVVTLTPKNYKGCIQVNGEGVDDDKFLLATCDASNPRQQFVFDGNLIKLALDMSKCFQAGRNNPEPAHGHFLRVFPCDSSNAQQLFTWDAPNGALTLVQFPSLAVVFQGVIADVNKDMIIMGDLGKESVEARKDWVILN